MSTTYANPASTTLTEVLPHDFTWSDRLDKDAVLPIDMAREFSEGTLVPAPYTDPRMADIARYAIMVDGDLRGRIVQCGPRKWEAFTADCSHSFGNLRTKEQAAAYILLSVER